MYVITHTANSNVPVTEESANYAKSVTLRNKAIRKPSDIQQYSKLSKNEYDNCVRVLNKSIPKRKKSKESGYNIYTEGDLLAFICLRYLIFVKRLSLSLLSQIESSISELFEICQHDFEQLRSWKLIFHSPNLKSLKWMKLSRSSLVDPEIEEIDPDELFVVELGKMVDKYERAVDNTPKTPEIHQKVEDIELSRLARKLDESRTING